MLNMFSNLINTDEMRAKLSHATYLIDVDLNKALDMFNAILKQEADCIKKRINVNQNSRNNELLDHECREARTNVRKLLKKCRKTFDSRDRNAFCKARRQCTNLVYRKKKYRPTMMLC